MEYPKIHSLFKRNKEDHSFIMGDYSCPEFELVKYWTIDEKIDGTNVRIEYDPNADEKINIFGRSKDSGLPTFLVEFLKSHFTVERMSLVFDPKYKCILFGEGYGNRIQSAGPFYCKDVNFMLFDIVVGSFWLKRGDVQRLAEQLQVPFPPSLGVMTESQILKFVQSKPQSVCSAKQQVMEGIIARTEPMLLFRSGKPLIWKLKVKDFE